MVTIESLTEVEAGLWMATWSSDLVSPTYYVYLDGLLVSTQTTESFTVRVQGEPLFVLGVYDDAAEWVDDVFPPAQVLGWLNDDDAAQYRIEEYSGGGWVERDLLQNDGDRAWWTYRTPVLADVTTHQWRVVPIDAAGNEGAPLAFAALMVRHPTAPDVSMAYASGTGKVTIDAA